MPTRIRKTTGAKVTTTPETEPVEQPDPATDTTEDTDTPEARVEDKPQTTVKTKAKPKQKVVVTQADLVLLTVVAAHQKNPTMRHLTLDGWICPHFDQPDKQEFKTATPEQAETLKACSACATKAARIRLETAS